MLKTLTLLICTLICLNLSAATPRELSVNALSHLDADGLLDWWDDWYLEAAAVEAVVLHFIGAHTTHPVVKDNRVKLLVEDIVFAALVYSVPPILVATTAFRESCYRTHAIGSLGEIGMMQVLGMAAKGCDLHTQQGQLLCGTRWMRAGYDTCAKTWTEAMTVYASGACAPRSDRVKRVRDDRIALWQRMRSKFMSVPENR